MSNSDSNNSAMSAKSFMDTMIQLGLIIFLLVMSFLVFKPFAMIMLWALVLSIMLYPLHQKLANKLGGKQGRAGTIIALSGCLLLGGPMTMLGFSLTTHIQKLNQSFEAGELSVKMPAESVQEWPVVGEKLYSAWSEAATDMPGFLDTHGETIKSLFTSFLSLAGDVIGVVFLFIGALIIAGIMMAWGREGTGAMLRIANRISGDKKGAQLQTTFVATVRSVATGVLGVAFIQAVLMGLGFIFGGIPAAGILAVIVLFMGILQLPALLISLPVIAWVWTSGDGSSVGNIIFTIYILIAGGIDGVLKPMLLGKGVSVPMPVVLIGALGGMAAGGLIGLFLGATLLVVTYELFMDWVDENDNPEAEAVAEVVAAEG